MFNYTLTLIHLPFDCNNIQLSVGYLQSSTERKSLSYDELLREIVDDEKQYIRHLNLILKVFMEPFLTLFPDPVSGHVIVRLL